MLSLDEYRALHDTAGIIDRSERAKIAVTGRDRAAWLQGLLTNDVAALGQGQGSYAAHLTPQGRMVTDMRILETGEAILLDFEPSLRQSILARFDQFIFAEDVQLEDLTDTHLLLGVHGPRAAAVVSDALARPCCGFEEQLAALQEYDHTSIDACGARIRIIASRDFGGAGFDLLFPAGAAGPVRRALSEAGAVDVSDEVAQTSRVEAGRPRFGVDMDADTIPLEAGIEDRAVSMTKGCYVGQEVIVRILHRGHGRVARKLVGLTVTSVNAESHIPRHGAPIEAAGHPIGHVTSSAFSPAVGRPIALGYVQRDFVDPGREVTIVSDGHSLPAIVTALPFVA